MDDFGTGYSSLSYLRTFPFDKIKIDRSFVREIAETDDSMAIVKAVAMLGASLGMTTTAEGVESEAELAFLKAVRLQPGPGAAPSSARPCSGPSRRPAARREGLLCRLTRIATSALSRHPPPSL